MKNFNFIMVPVVIFAISVCSMRRAVGGTIILSGDSSPLGPFLGPGYPANNDATFFQNALFGGKSVLVTGGSYQPVDLTALSAFYNGLSGVTSSVTNSALTSQSLGNVNLLVDILPDNAFTATEAAAVNGFLGKGGNVFLDW